MQLPWKTLLFLLALMWLPLASLPQPSRPAQATVKPVAMETQINVRPHVAQVYALVNSRWFAVDSLVATTCRIGRILNTSGRAVLLTEATVRVVGQCVTKLAVPLRNVDVVEASDWDLITNLQSRARQTKAEAEACEATTQTASPEELRPQQPLATRIEQELPHVSGLHRQTKLNLHSTRFGRRSAIAPIRTARGMLNRSRF